MDVQMRIGGWRSRAACDQRTPRAIGPSELSGVGLSVRVTKRPKDRLCSSLKQRAPTKLSRVRPSASPKAHTKKYTRLQCCSSVTTEPFGCLKSRLPAQEGCAARDLDFLIPALHSSTLNLFFLMLLDTNLHSNQHLHRRPSSLVEADGSLSRDGKDIRELAHRHLPLSLS